jgi:hypothetical protein
VYRSQVYRSQVYRSQVYRSQVYRISLALTLCGLLAAIPAFAQAPSYSPDRLAALVAPVALYPDPLLAQVLAASTFSDQLTDAARWADQHRDLRGEPLARAMQHQPLPWDPTVQSLLPFPSVLDMMASDPTLASKLGSAFLAQQQDVLKAVQTERVKAKDFGYLRSDKHTAVGSPPYVTIMPTDPAQIFVPTYDPAVVYSAPSPDLVLADAIRFKSHVSVGGFRLAEWHFAKFQVIGGYFQAWGWGLGGIDWPMQKVIINGTAWQRDWTNRGTYVHRYPDLEHVPPAQ